jgi:hypothetical protein
MRAERQLSNSEYVLLHFVAEMGADRGKGIPTSNGGLTDALGVSDSTIRRGLRKLRALGLLAFTDHPGPPCSPLAPPPCWPRSRANLGHHLGHPSLHGCEETRIGKRKNTRSTSVTSARAETERETLLLEASLSPNGPGEAGPSSSAAQEAAPPTPAKGARFPEPPPGDEERPPGRRQPLTCTFEYRHPESGEAVPCGSTWHDEGDLYAHFRRQHPDADPAAYGLHDPAGHEPVEPPIGPWPPEVSGTKEDQ